MSTLTQGDLRIECAVPITDIRSFHMEIRGNDHAVCHIEGTIPEAEVRKLSCSRWRGLRSWQVLADTPGAKLWFHGVDRTIRSPLYQIEETDWGF